MKESSQTAARVRITGRVQGVGFRYFVYKHATRNGITGWVRNRNDGSVEAKFEGPESQVEAIISLCSRGPLGSNVKNVEVERYAPEGKYSEFSFRYE